MMFYYDFWVKVIIECKIWNAIWHHDPVTEEQVKHRNHFVAVGLKGQYGYTTIS